MSEDDIREIRINPIIPTESVLIATARSSRPRKKNRPLSLTGVCMWLTATSAWVTKR